jgi:integrase
MCRRHGGDVEALRRGHGEGKAHPLARVAGGGERAAVCLRRLGRERSRRRVRGPGRLRGSRHRVEAGHARREVQPGDGQPGGGHRRADVRAGGPPHRREAGPDPQARPSPTPLTRQQEAAPRRAAGRRRPRDAAITGVLLDTGARVGKCTRLDAEDFAITAPTGKVRLHDKGDEVCSVPLARRGRELVLAWLDVRGPLRSPWWPAETCRPRSPTVCWAGSRSHVCPQGIYTSQLADSDGPSRG